MLCACGTYSYATARQSLSLPLPHALHARRAIESSMAIHLAETARGYGAMAARLTPDQKVGSSNLSGLISLRAHFLS